MNLARRDLLALGLTAAIYRPSAAFAASPPPTDPASSTGPGAPSEEWPMWDALQFGLEGRGWSDVARPLSRLPERAESLVNGTIWRLAQHTAGMSLSFRSDAEFLRFEVSLLEPELAMPHMPATGKSGFDLYAREKGQPWRWVFTAQPHDADYVALVRGLRPGKREYRLHLPLYNGVEQLRVGAPEGSKIESVAPRQELPIVYYGTSIAQGACASRPGMAFVTQLGRRLDVPMINLGFSGNGRLDPELCDLIAELDARAYVLDCLPNLTPEATAERAMPFVRRLRALRPETPIVMVEDRTDPNAAMFPLRSNLHVGNHRAFRTAYEGLLEEGVAGLTYVADRPFLGEDGEATVDGSHPSDLGMVRYADALEPVLRDVLSAK
ncbi:hypothetical protein Poly30_02760 [Planctomycetes bacterium Poly30]|uniref:SGNH hydrolase-type esterase domain-containing protein n=1 Tax=Saltatorellus ferox TaxID=2528018 RepID=A0A518EL16_9BACT|nr:hypothetical protein Poly30_02760 [Planctomycetes bacterium Poly30]